MLASPNWWKRASVLNRTPRFKGTRTKPVQEQEFLRWKNAMKKLSSSATASCMEWETLSNSDVIYAGVFLFPTTCTGSRGHPRAKIIQSLFQKTLSSQDLDFFSTPWC
ncbi:hypothetical protein XENORESO_002566 [Xenotaenia resolanae]|uniref:Uncharacterized protein n=1 Tax=Xenotaenia resolanae TaxID=208358 RepID=A0ABV0W0P9_9TELE